MNITARRLTEVADLILDLIEKCDAGANADELRSVAEQDELVEALAFLCRLGYIKLVGERTKP